MTDEKNLGSGDAAYARDLEEKIAKLESHNAEPEPWDDIRDEWTDAIFAAYPTRSGSHAEYAIAMKMVSHRHGKSALVALVNWLLVRNAKLDEDLKSHRVHLAFASRENLFGVKPDGTPSEASLHITKLRVLLDRVLKDARISGADQISDETKKDIREALVLKP